MIFDEIVIEWREKYTVKIFVCSKVSINQALKGLIVMCLNKMSFNQALDQFFTPKN